jgi:hypothetical protein
MKEMDELKKQMAEATQAKKRSVQRHTHHVISVWM